ncbi:MAG: NUDIX domain-containing protein [Candidatus Saccharimonas sp.]
MNLQVGVKVLIINSTAQYLFLQRSVKLSTDSNETSWDIPGGRINTDEALLDALTREIEEEIGHSITTTPELIASQDIFVESEDLHVVRLTYMVKEDISNINLSSEHDSYQWVDKVEIKNMNTEPYLAQVLNNL